MQFLEFPVSLANIIAIVLPIIAVCFFFIIIPWLKNGSGSKLRRYLSYTITPPRIGSEESEVPDSGTKEKHAAQSREDKVKLYFFYLGIALFLVSFVIGEFYEVMIDLLLPINQTGVEEMRTATTVVFQSLFNAGWVGALPWTGFTTYHETWNWVFVTAAITDNPHFLSSLVTWLLLFSIIIGIVFLSPLAIKRIRHSFLPSMFFFMVGMTIFTKAAVGYFAETLVLAFTHLELHYMHITVTGDMIPNLTGVLTSCILLIPIMFAIFVLFGRRLWKIYYTDSRSRNWFTVYITLSFWLGIVLTMMVV